MPPKLTGVMQPLIIEQYETVRVRPVAGVMVHNVQYNAYGYLSITIPTQQF